MPIEQNILVAGRSPDVVNEIASMLESQDHLTIGKRLLVNGHHDPLQDLDAIPAIVVLCLSKTSQQELEAFANHPADQRPVLVIVGADEHSCLMRLAMQAGARDFLSSPVNERELIRSVQRIMSDLKPKDSTPASRVVTFINAKGGSGSSFLAANYAYTSQALGNRKTLLLDLDRQFAPLPQYLDVEPQASLFDALYVVSELDELAVEGFIARHASGLGLMASNLALNGEEAGGQIDEGEALDRLLEVLLRRHERIVAEVPRHLDEVGAAMLRASDRILVVMQQTVPDLRNASRLSAIMTKELGIDPACIQPLVNRYDSKSSTTIEDISKVLQTRNVHKVTNDFAHVSESIDMGVPLAELNPKAPAVAALHALHKTFEGIEEKQSSGLLSRLMRK
jgi:pilus assembly protein CpaE